MTNNAVDTQRIRNAVRGRALATIAADAEIINFDDFDDLRASHVLPNVVDMVMNRCPSDSFDYASME